MSTAIEIILGWFTLSIITEITGMFLLWIWLRRRGVRLLFTLIGTPGYLEYRYLRWCRENGRSAKRILWLRVALHLNAIVAAAVTIPYLQGMK